MFNTKFRKSPFWILNHGKYRSIAINPSKSLYVKVSSRVGRLIELLPDTCRIMRELELSSLQLSNIIKQLKNNGIIVDEKSFIGFKDLSIEDYKPPKLPLNLIIDYDLKLNNDTLNSLKNLSRCGFKYIILRLNRKIQPHEALNKIEEIKNTEINLNPFIYLDFKLNEKKVQNYESKNCGLIINEEKLIGQKLDSIGKNISIARKIQIKDSTNFITDLTELSHNFKHPPASTNIYIDDASNILPHPNELFFLGKLDDVKDSDFLKKNKQYLFYLKHNRTVNYKCKTCEYNFLCPLPIHDRESADDLLSPPINCSYNQKRGIFENA
ncbi:hypothetical protein [Idiomarina sp.]|uniref:hypothetical protein n=1 Tax=Idiomarina sp. TaxID=1874361 RepID=UPI00258EC618|nr:hypothetical protein [Idiomarina sp.]